MLPFLVLYCGIFFVKLAKYTVKINKESIFYIYIFMYIIPRINDYIIFIFIF